MLSTGKLFPMMAVAMVAIFLADTAQAKRGCASFGHSCFGGHGKRAEVAPGGTEPFPAILPVDNADFQVLDIFRQFCSLQPEQYLRLAPVFRKLAATYTAEEEPLPRK